jgi:hypothetical protein
MDLQNRLFADMQKVCYLLCGFIRFKVMPRALDVELQCRALDVLILAHQLNKSILGERVQYRPKIGVAY